MESVRAVRAVLIDIDAVLTASWKPLPGAVKALRQVRAAGLGVALLTNTTSRTRASIAEALAGAGFPVGPRTSSPRPRPPRRISPSTSPARSAPW